MEKLHVKVPDATKFDKKENDNASTTSISPLAANLFLSSPCNNTESHLGLGGKLVRCTSTPSYSSLSKFSVQKNLLFTSNIQLDQELREVEETKNKHALNSLSTTQDSLYGSSCDNTANDNDALSSSNSSRGKQHKMFFIKFRVTLSTKSHSYFMNRFRCN